jgi:hypothetical protein
VESPRCIACWLQLADWANNPYYAQPIRELGFTLYGVNAQGITVSTAQASAQALALGFQLVPATLAGSTVS